MVMVDGESIQPSSIAISHQPFAMTELIRRQFISAVLAPAVFRQTSDERFLASMPLGGARGTARTPLERLLGRGLSARLFTDLSTISNEDRRSQVIATGRFFVRTAAPRALPDHSDASRST